MADVKDVLSAALRAAHSAVSFLPPAEPRRAANSSWTAIKAVLDYNFADDAASPIERMAEDPTDLLWAIRAIENVQAELQSEVDVAEALQWVNKLQTTAWAVAAKLALASVEDVKPKVEAEPVPNGRLEVMVIDGSDDEVSADEKPDIAVFAPQLPTPPASTPSASGTRARKPSATPSFSVIVPSRRCRSHAPDVQVDEKEAPSVKKSRTSPQPRAAAKRKAKAKAKASKPPPSPLSLGINPFDIASADFRMATPAELEQSKVVGSFHNIDYPAKSAVSNSTIRHSSFGPRFFLQSQMNFGINHTLPQSGRPFVMFCGMKKSEAGVWRDGKVLQLARDRLETKEPIGIVAAASEAHSEAANRWYPLGRYIVKDIGSAPLGAFSQASEAGRSEALATLRHYLKNDPKWIVNSAGLFRGAVELDKKELEVLQKEARQGGEAFDARLACELDNLDQNQRLAYAIFEYNSPYDPKELEEAMVERRTGDKKADLRRRQVEAWVEKKAKVEAEKAAGTFVEPKKGKGRKKAASPPPESDAEDSDAPSEQLEWDEGEETEEEDEEDEGDEYED